MKPSCKNIKDIASNLTLGDKLLIISLLLVSVVSYVFFFTFSNSSGEKVVTVKQGEKTLLQLSLDGGKNNGIYYFNFDKGVGALEVKDGSVRMLPMDKSICPEGICSKTGWIDGGYKSIVCLPNRLIVRIDSKEKSAVDSVSS